MPQGPRINPQEVEAVRDEIELLKSLKKNDAKFEDTVVDLLDHFEHYTLLMAHMAVIYVQC